MKKLILVTVDTDKEDNYLADALSAKIVFRLRNFVPGEPDELVRLAVENMVVIDMKELT